jgi:hypothetical protein
MLNNLPAEERAKMMPKPAATKPIVISRAGSRLVARIA